MPKTPRTYTRFSRTRRHLGGFSKLWLATDHLLQVQSTGYTERYQRFYLRDIKGIFVMDSDRRFYCNIVWIACAVVAALSLLLADCPVIVVIIVVGFFIALLVWNQLLGPSCRVYLTTGVQTTRLEPLVRVRSAEKTLARLRPLVEAAQADLATAPSALARSEAPPPMA
jgi:hypothetical protein